MRLFVESILPCRPSEAWSAVQNSGLPQDAARPLRRMMAADEEALPDAWAVGATVRCPVRLFGVIPLGTRVIHFEPMDHGAPQMQTRHSGPLVKRWDHRIRIAAAGRGQCRYSDEIDIEAGWLTPAIALVAWCLSRWRQRLVGQASSLAVAETDRGVGVLACRS